MLGTSYLLPQGIAKLADEGILAALKAKREAEEAAARKVCAARAWRRCIAASYTARAGARTTQVLDEAKALATALSTIGKFTVKVKVGEEKRIFGRRVLAAGNARPASSHADAAPAGLSAAPRTRSVSEQDVIDAIAKQTNKVLEKRNIVLPEIKTTGTYEVQVKVHPQVTAKVQLIVAKL